jgi:transposase
MKSGTKCPTKTIHWQENAKDIVHEFFEDGTSKGLLVLGRELGLLEPNRKYKLQDLRQIIGNHPAFKNKSKLEVLAEKYNVQIVFSPKFHCELNPIEGLWCFQKVYIRKTR